MEINKSAEARRERGGRGEGEGRERGGVRGERGEGRGERGEGRVESGEGRGKEDQYTFEKRCLPGLPMQSRLHVREKTVWRSMLRRRPQARGKAVRDSASCVQ